MRQQPDDETLSHANRVRGHLSPRSSKMIERRVRRTSCRPDSFHLHGTAVQCREERGRKIFRKKWSEL